MNSLTNLKIKRIDPDVWDVVVNGTRDQRDFICSQEPMYFCLYYFSEYFEYALADFHYVFFEDFKNLIFGKVKEAQWIAFRESAKTTIAKMCLTWAIVYAHKKYISYGSYEKDNAEAALFDIIIWLQTNTRIIKDYGYLYRRKKRQGESDEVQLKQKALFITTNKVRVIAFSTQESTRGHIFDKFRPDLYIYDDIENSVTKDSHAITGKVIAHLEEARTGLAPYGGVLYLCNYIRDDGSVQYVKENLERMENGVVRNIPVKFPDGVMAWKDKYVDTKAQEAEANAIIEEKRQRKVSLERKREELKDGVYFTEMMNEPGKSGDYYFDREKVRAAQLKIRKPIKVIGTMDLYTDYIPSHRYATGVDSAEGIGGDSSTSMTIDFSPTPAALVASFEDNQISQTVFAGQVAKQGRRFGECFLVPEVNKGYGTISKLIADEEDGGYGYTNMYIRQVKNKTTNQFQPEFGFHTNSKTRPDILANLKDAFEDGLLDIPDEGTLTEMLYFRKADAHRIRREQGATRHFDKVIAVALAWEGRKYATASEVDPEGDMYISPQTKEEEMRRKMG